MTDSILADLNPDAQNWAGLRVMVVSPTPTHPQDHGNRKRIHAVCSALKSRGAHVHFVHFAVEHDWQKSRPVHHEHMMRESWDAYDLVAPSRPVHQPPRKRDHSVDEWEDESLSAFVAWACKIHNIDAVIVNYTWMSFCLDSIPAKIYKILDTHDAFGHRRAALRSLGIEPEFFHTTPDEEAKAIARADLIWAIKDSERDYFTFDLGAPNCLTMLHAEPPRKLWQGAQYTGGYLRAGVIGARNSVNKRNLEEFLETALPLFASYFADVKIVIAGGCADDFTKWVHPNVEIVGPVDDVADFYRSVDLVIAPIKASTGLKIKVAEALAYAMPVVALAHAMEGFPTTDPLHQLPDFKALALELVKLAFEPEPLAPLAIQSEHITHAVATAVAETFDQTRNAMVTRRTDHLCIVLPMAAFSPASLLHEQLLPALHSIRRSTPVSFYITGPATRPDLTIFDAFGYDLPTFADPALIDELGDEAPEFWRPIGLTQLLRHHKFEHALILSDCLAALKSNQAESGIGALKRVYVRHDAIALTGGDPDALVNFLSGKIDTIVLAADARTVAHWRGSYGVKAVASIPFRAPTPFKPSQPLAPSTTPLALILAVPNDPLHALIITQLEELGAHHHTLDPADPILAAQLINPITHIPSPRDLIVQARILINLTPHHPAATAVSEAAQSLGTPIITPERGEHAAALLHMLPATRPTTVLRLLRIIALTLAGGDATTQLRNQTFATLQSQTAADAGWIWLTRDLAASRAAAQATTSAEELFSV